MRALITNDDGIGADGLMVLTEEALAAGFEVVVAAPDHDASGASGSLLSERPVTVEEPSIGIDVPTYAVAAHPAFIVLAAAQGAFGPMPDVVLSGVNHGANLGRAVLHSGTVGAALTGALKGTRSLAVSLALGEGDWQWDSVRTVLKSVLPMVGEMGPGTAANLNVPAVAPGRLGELRRARLARHGSVQTRIELVDGVLRRVWAGLPTDPEPGTDVALLEAGFPTISEITSVDDAAAASRADRSLRWKQ